MVIWNDILINILIIIVYNIFTTTSLNKSLLIQSLKYNRIYFFDVYLFKFIAKSFNVE